jgi:hypothetical protein
MIWSSGKTGAIDAARTALFALTFSNTPIIVCPWLYARRSCEKAGLRQAKNS